MSVIWIVNQYGGIPRVGIHSRHYQLARRFADKGHSVFLFSANNHHHKACDGKSRNIERENVQFGFDMVWLFTLQYKSSQSIIRFINWFVFAFSLFFLRPRNIPKPDVIYYSSLSLIGSVAAELISKFYGIPYIYEERDIWPLTLHEIKSVSRYNPIAVFLSLIQRRAYRKADLVISTLPGLQDHIRSKNIVENSFLWLPNGCTELTPIVLSDADQRILKKIKTSKFSVCYVGSLGRANRIDILLEAARILRDQPDVEFFLFGGGVLCEEYKVFVRENGLTNVHFLGPVDRSLVPEIYSKVDVCYLGWGDYKMYNYGVSANKLSEYMFFGKPILHSYSGKFDFVEQSGGGITVPACDPKAVATGVTKLQQLSNANLMKMGQNSSDFAERHFDYDLIFEKLNQTLKNKSWIV